MAGTPGPRFSSHSSISMFLPYTPPAAPSETAPAENGQVGRAAGDNRGPLMRPWEPLAVFLVSFLAFALLTPRITTYLDPLTGDEPFYLMTALSILQDGDLNECNNYRQRTEAAIYPSFYTSANGGFAGFPPGWKGWTGAPYPLPPHPSQIIPATRQCISTDPNVPLPADGTGSELYSKHGLGLTLLVLPAFSIGDRMLVVYFLNVLGALLAMNIYMLAREVTRRVLPALLTWLAFAFTVPLLPYSFLIFPEMPAALFVVYAFRRIRAWDNNRWQIAGVGFSLGFMPWLHYRFIPVVAGLVLFYLWQEYRFRTKRRFVDLGILLGLVGLGAVSLMAYFYHRYGQVTPNPADHAGSNDLAGTLRGAAGLLYDQQWGLFIAAPVFILALVGVVVMAREREWRKDLLWLAVIFVPYFGVIANYAQWWGEWCPPARYMASALPLLAVPFAVSLERIKSHAYKGVYAVLLLLSLGMMWGFLYQPQWMYHQPDGRNQVFLYGVPQLLANTPLSSQANTISNNLVESVPSFVRPYFEYAMNGPAQGDAASAQAWNTSIWLFLATIAITAGSLLLHRHRMIDTADAAPGASSGIYTPPPTPSEQPGSSGAVMPYLPSEPPNLPAQPAGRSSATTLLAPERTTTPAEVPLSGLPLLQPIRPGQTRNGKDHAAKEDRFSLNPADAQALAQGWSAPIRTEAEAAKEPGLRKRIAGSWVWRSRGLWLGIVALGLALFAQRMITVDRLILPSIRWYALAIFVMLLGWAGTYKNKSFLVVPVRRQTADPMSSGGLVVRAKAVAASSPPEALEVADQSRKEALQHLIARRMGRSPGNGSTAPETATSNGHGTDDGAHDDIQPSSRARVLRVIGARLPLPGASWWRYALAFIAVAINFYSVSELRRDYYSAVGGYGWLFSLALLAGAFVGERRTVVRDLDDTNRDAEDRDNLRFPRGIELFVMLAIFALALGLRLYKLGDWTTGMHGDEGEAGMDALRILEGNAVSPFLTGWFSQPNFYYWGVAIGMKVFGTDLFGLRMFSALSGAIMVIPFFLLVKMWFGSRTATIASVLLAVSNVAIHFSKQEFSNITTPLFLVTGFYFLFRGLRTRSTLDFILAGYAHMLSIYFYLGGRLGPIMLAAFLAYLFILMPVLRLPGVYREVRRLTPDLSKLRILRRAAATQARGLFHYLGPVIMLGLASISMASPWLAYFVDHQAELNARSGDKIIFSPGNVGRMAQQYQATNTPLYVGLRMPRPGDNIPVSPLVFEQTPLSVKLTDDGFWTRVLWGQLTTTLSMFTYRFDASSVYTFTGEPVSKPIEAALLILGLAWAAWRWRDTRFALLSLWFWLTIIVGGVLTIDAPYMARIIGVVPVMAVLAAVPLNKLAAELSNAFGNIGRIRISRRIPQVATGLLLAGLLGYLGMQNYTDYFTRYIATWPFTEVTGQAYFVRDMNTRVQAEGRPKPKYYELGAHFIYWGHGNNRFLSYGTDGIDMVNASNELPILDEVDRDAVFMVWDVNKQYLPIIKSYYPNGEEKPFIYGPNGSGPTLFTSYRVKSEEINARRMTTALYTPANGPAVQREEPSVGTGGGGPPPDGLAYPVRAEWSGNFVAPAMGRYTFIMDATQGGSFNIDGTEVLTTSVSTPRAEKTLLLSRGPHEVKLTGSMERSNTEVKLLLSAGGAAPELVPRRLLWSGPRQGLLGQIRPFVTGGQLSAGGPQQVQLQQSLLSSRIDGFLGFRDAPSALSSGGLLFGTWTGTLKVPQTGSYAFEVFSNGESQVLIDGQPVLVSMQSGGQAMTSTGQVTLTAGDHAIEVRYNWLGGTGYLEVFWTPPGGQRAMLGPDVLSTAGGIVDAAVVSEPPPVELKPAAPPKKLVPQTVITGVGTLSNPRGLAVDGSGLVYVGDRGNNRVVVFSPDGKVQRTIGKAAAGTVPQPGEIGDIVDIAVSNDGTLYVMENLGNRLQVFDKDGKSTLVLAGDAMQSHSPNGISAGPDGSIYIAVTGQSRVLRLSPGASMEGATSITGTDEQAKIEQPVDVAVDEKRPERIYAIDLRERLMLLSPDGNIVKQWRLAVGKDDGGSRLAVSSDGSKIYMSDPDRQRISVVNVDSGAVEYFGAPGGGAGEFRGPSGIDVGPDGRLYVLDRVNNNVQVFELGR